ncbi:1080_t:CDS:2 [Diversispora eburnea]|uniref:1080_t:CDS:1 n=1 Tax=Diversispora eburnea TaxID=1213867 RepID=A0A9N8ZZ90_9GLOM|nr:1080_t:CDS:2 [Diversispora eburnea]
MNKNNMPPSQNPVKNINDILNYVNNLQDLTRKNRKNKINQISRPQNSWVLFRKDYEANKRNQFPDTLFKMKTVSINAGDVWKNQSSQVKRYFEILLKLALAKHKIMYPDYKYTPKRRYK